jgi:hypothetical protein
MPEVEEFLALPLPRDRITLITQVRSTLLASSVRALQTRGDFERYLTVLPAELHERITQMVAGVWIPLEIAQAHYTACNQLGYGPTEFAEMGRDVGSRIHTSILSTVVAMAKNAGVTPWTIFAQFRRFWERIMVGGGIGVTKIGPKEAHVEVVGCPLVSIPYYRSAQRALFLGLIELFCTKAYASDVSRALTLTSMTYRFAWA